MAVGPRPADTESADAERRASADSHRVGLRPGVKALVTREGRVLLVREAHDDGEPFWTLPGGGIRPGETLRAALRRELVEELGAELRVGARVGLCPYRHRSTPGLVSVYVVFAGTLRGSPDPNRAEGIRRYTWAPAASPPASLLPAFEARLDAFVETATAVESSAVDGPRRGGQR